MALTLRQDGCVQQPIYINLSRLPFQQYCCRRLQAGLQTVIVS